MTLPPDVLRVATYNVRDLKDDAAAAARVVRAIGPDVLCLQEVPRHILSGHRVGDFASACGMLFTGGHQGGGGTTVLTSLRVDVTSSAHVALRVPRFARPRGYAVLRLALPGRRPLRVVSVHLSLDPGERVAHVQTLLDAIEGRSGVGSDDPVVIGADLNETSEGAAWQLLASRLRLVSGAGPTFPARAPRRRIDALFATSDLAAAAADGTAASPDPADLVAATDHLPVWADLAVG